VTDRQLRGSRHGFDPAPQFSVHEVSRGRRGRIAVIGRCWFGPIVVGTRFTRLAWLRASPAVAPVPCRLEVEWLELFRKPAVEVTQVYTARIGMRGEPPEGLTEGVHDERLLLVGELPPEGTWEWDGRFWVRGPRPLPDDQATG
jgi:hypothetical protein